MEELETNPEGEAPQQPEATSPDQPAAAAPDQLAASPDQPAAVTTQEPESTTAPTPEATAEPYPAATISMEELLAPDAEAPAAAPMEDVQLMAVLEAVVYVAEEPLTLAQIAAALRQPAERVDAVLRQLIA